MKWILLKSMDCREPSVCHWNNGDSIGCRHMEGDLTRNTKGLLCLNWETAIRLCPDPGTEHVQNYKTPEHNSVLT